MSTNDDKEPKNKPWLDPGDPTDDDQGKSRQESQEESQEDSYFSEDSNDLYNSLSNDSPEMLVQILELQVAELRDRELKAQAELENFRRRILRDVDGQLKYAALPLVTDLLDVLDNLNRAIDSATPGSSIEGLAAGVKLVQQQFVNVLSKHHCKQIPGVGKPFDPNVHQAIAQQPSDAHSAGSVMVEHSTGYTLHERVVRPSMVVVSTGPVS
jgi:molecular chaperone GrpE